MWKKKRWNGCRFTFLAVAWRSDSSLSSRVNLQPVSVLVCEAFWPSAVTSTKKDRKPAELTDKHLDTFVTADLTSEPAASRHEKVSDQRQNVMRLWAPGNELIRFTQDIHNLFLFNGRRKAVQSKCTSTSLFISLCIYLSLFSLSLILFLSPSLRSSSRVNRCLKVSQIWSGKTRCGFHTCPASLCSSYSLFTVPSPPLSLSCPLPLAVIPSPSLRYPLSSLFLSIPSCLSSLFLTPLHSPSLSFPSSPFSVSLLISCNLFDFFYLYVSPPPSLPLCLLPLSVSPTHSFLCFLSFTLLFPITVFYSYCPFSLSFFFLLLFSHLLSYYPSLSLSSVSRSLHHLVSYPFLPPSLQLSIFPSLTLSLSFYLSSLTLRYHLFSLYYSFSIHLTHHSIALFPSFSLSHLFISHYVYHFLLSLTFFFSIFICPSLSCSVNYFFLYMSTLLSLCASLFIYVYSPISLFYFSFSSLSSIQLIFPLFVYPLLLYPSVHLHLYLYM